MMVILRRIPCALEHKLTVWDQFFELRNKFLYKRT